MSDLIKQAEALEAQASLHETNAELTLCRAKNAYARICLAQRDAEVAALVEAAKLAHAEIDKISLSAANSISGFGTKENRMRIFTEAEAARWALESALAPFKETP